MRTAIFAAAIGLAAAQPHRHAHQHLHQQRNPTPDTDIVTVPGPTVIAYELNGAVISQEEVLEGIKNGSLIWANGAPQVQTSSSTSLAAYTSSASSSSSSVSVAPTTSSSSYVATSSTSLSSYSAPSSSSVAASSSSASASASSGTSSSSSSSSSGSVSGGSGVNSAFPDGELDCSTFPSDYGAMYVSYMGLGGWIGIQDPGSDSGGFSNIETVTSSSCPGGSSCCSEGMYCSYACPAGYQKSQWPTTQGSTGQSVGGLLCQNGKLHLTNSDLSSNICIPGATQVNIQVENQLSQSVAVCRTDYPGSCHS